MECFAQGHTADWQNESLTKRKGVGMRAGTSAKGLLVALRNSWAASEKTVWPPSGPVLIL